jgi:phosphoenolpyruvate phosphomutase
MTRSFKELLARPGPAVLVGAHNGLSARLVEDAGFDAVWASSFEISAANAVPDAGILGMGECLPIVANICDSAAIPTLVDVDTGYGNGQPVSQAVQPLGRDGTHP